MGHYCDAPNKTKPGYCGRWLVNYEHCEDHRQGAAPAVTPSAPPPRRVQEAGAALLADVLADGIDRAIADRVADYVGEGVGRRWLRDQPWNTAGCERLADTAMAILELKKRTHEAVGAAVAAMLPPGTPEFHRELTGRIVERIPLPLWDAKLDAVVRGIQVVGIFKCLAIHQLPASSCACLRMLGGEVAEEEVKRRVVNLLDQTRQDLHVQETLDVGPASGG
jgi:hypothetical protein